jgi:hypothetical protein
MVAPLRLSRYCAALPSQRHQPLSTGGPIQSGSAIAWVNVIGSEAWTTGAATRVASRAKASGARRMGRSGKQVGKG